MECDQQNIRADLTQTLKVSVVCRLCLGTTSLVDIKHDSKILYQLAQCFPDLMSDDVKFPSYVCNTCYQLVEITHKFVTRARQSACILRSCIRDSENQANAANLQPKQDREAKDKLKINSVATVKQQCVTKNRTDSTEEEVIKKRRIMNETSTGQVAAKTVNEESPMDENFNYVEEQMYDSRKYSEKNSRQAHVSERITSPEAAGFTANENFPSTWTNAIVDQCSLGLRRSSKSDRRNQKRIVLKRIEANISTV